MAGTYTQVYSGVPGVAWACSLCGMPIVEITPGQADMRNAHNVWHNTLQANLDALALKIGIKL